MTYGILLDFDCTLCFIVDVRGILVTQCILVVVAGVPSPSSPPTFSPEVNTSHPIPHSLLSLACYAAFLINFITFLWPFFYLFHCFFLLFWYPALPTSLSTLSVYALLATFPPPQFTTLHFRHPLSILSLSCSSFILISWLFSPHCTTSTISLSSLYYSLFITFFFSFVYHFPYTTVSVKLS